MKGREMERTGEEDYGAGLVRADAVGDGLEVEGGVGEGDVAAVFGEGGVLEVGVRGGHGGRAGRAVLLNE